MSTKTLLQECLTYDSSKTSGLMYLFVPTLGLGATSRAPVDCVCVTARPKSATQHVPFDFTNIFLLLMSRCAIAGLPYRTIMIQT